MYLDAKTASYDVDQCVRDQFGNPIFATSVTEKCSVMMRSQRERQTRSCEFVLTWTETVRFAKGEVQVDKWANPPVDLPGVTFTPEAGVVKVGELRVFR